MERIIVQCINTQTTSELEFHKEYAVINEASGQYLVYNDDGIQCWYNQDLFIKVPLPRAHCDVIIEWANGATIQWRLALDSEGTTTWQDCCSNTPCWSPENQYRVRPANPNTIRINELEKNLASLLNKVRATRKELTQLQ